MLQDKMNFLSGAKMTALSAFFLILSVILHILRVDICFDFSILTILISGLPIFYKAMKALFFNGKMTASLLITLAMAASIAVEQNFAAAEIALIMAIGSILEDWTVEKAKKGIKQLLSITPQTARKITVERTGEKIIEKEETILVSDIQKGDIIRVLAGENIPVDGVIAKGETSINQSVLTGEFQPVDKITGEDVLSGTTNCFGVIDIKTTKVSSDSYLQKLIKLVVEAQADKAPTKRIVDVWASILIPMAILFAIGVYLTTGEILRAVTVLVVFCPCSLVLATPTSIMAAIGHAAKNGIVVKSGEALEIIGKCSIFAFDKTGTLTKGGLTVADIKAFNGANPDKILYLAASGEKMSEHPIGKAIVEFALLKNVELGTPIDFKMFSGRGIYHKLDNKRIYVGCEKFFEDNNIALSGEIKQTANKERLDGKITLIVAVDKVVCGLISLSDTLKENVEEVIENLKTEAETVMLTGDNSLTGEYFGKKSGVNSIVSNLLPKQKAELIQRMRFDGKKVCMTGDGVNDAIALKTADVGVSMGALGSDIAIESSDIIITSDDLLKIPYLKNLSKLCIGTIQTNIIISMTINIISLSLSAMGVLTPATGAIVHNAASIIVVLNAAFLYDKEIA